MPIKMMSQKEFKSLALKAAPKRRQTPLNSFPCLPGKGDSAKHSRSIVRETEKNENFCLVFPEAQHDLYSRLIQGFDRGAFERNHQAALFATDNDMHRQADIMLQILDKKMAGVAVVPMLNKPTPLHHLEQLQIKDIPVVFCMQSVEGVSAPLVTWNSEKVGRMAARVFLQGGHHRIGCLIMQDDSLAESYLRGIQTVLAESGCAMQQHDILYTSTTDNYQTTKKYLQKRFSEPNPPTAIFCDHDTQAQRLYWAARDMNLSVPGDLAIISFGDAVRDGTFRRQLASVTISGVELGQKAAVLLDDMRSGKRPINSTEVVLIEPAFYPGTTV